MRGLAFIATMALVLAGCNEDETVSGYVDPSATWHLTSLDTAPFDARATLTFPEQGRASGQGPCNNFSGTQSAPYPWILIEDIAATRAACPELEQEHMFLLALAEMTLAEVSGDVLILSNDAGREMVFERR